MAAPASPTTWPRNASSFLGSGVPACASAMPMGRDSDRHEVTSREKGLRVVTAEYSSFYGSSQVLRERWAVLSDAGEGVEESLARIDTRLLGRGRRLATAPPEASGLRE